MKQFDMDKFNIEDEWYSVIRLDTDDKIRRERSKEEIENLINSADKRLLEFWREMGKSPEEFFCIEEVNAGIKIYPLMDALHQDFKYVEFFADNKYLPRNGIIKGIYSRMKYCNYKEKFSNYKKMTYKEWEKMNDKRKLKYSLFQSFRSNIFSLDISERIGCNVDIKPVEINDCTGQKREAENKLLFEKIEQLIARIEKCLMKEVKAAIKEENKIYAEELDKKSIEDLINKINSVDNIIIFCPANLKEKVESIINEIGRDDITAVPAKYLNNELILIDLDFVRLCYKFKPFVKIMSKSNFYAKYKSKKYYNYDLMIDIPLTLKIFNNQNFASLKIEQGVI